MIATDTSTAAFDSIRDQLSEKQRQVRHVLQKFGPMTNDEVAATLGWEINRVTGRMKELREIGAVIEAGYATSKTGRRVHRWKLRIEPPAPKPEQKPASLF